MSKSPIAVLIAISPCLFAWQCFSQEYISEPNHERASFNFRAGDPLNLPAVGDNYLRVLSPDTLELVRVTAGNDSTWNNFDSSPPATSKFQVTADGSAVTVSSVGYKRRPLYAPLEKNDLRVEKTLYLKLASPLASSVTLVEVKNSDTTLWPTTMKFIALNHALRYSPVIHVNQEGYLPAGPQKAIIGYYCGNLGQLNLSFIAGASAVKLVDAATGQPVANFSPSLSTRNDANADASSQYQGLREVDFNGFNQPGEYLLRVDGLGASFPFRIGDEVFMKLTRAYALGLYHQRCGSANQLPYTRFTHGACHTAPANVPLLEASYQTAWNIMAAYGNVPHQDQKAAALNDPSTMLFPFSQTRASGNNGFEVVDINGVGRAIDVSGGHHDAGDYSKYTFNSAHLIHVLVFAGDNFPHVGDLDNLGIPESGNGKGDVFDEAKWEADFLLKMQDKGTVLYNMQPVADGGFYSLVYPKTREYEDGVLPDEGDPQIVWPKTTSVTAAAVAALAEIGSSPKFCTQFGLNRSDWVNNPYLAAAKRGWDSLMRALDQYGKDQCYQKLYHYGNIFTHNDELAWAAAAMFAAGYSDAQQSHDPHYLLQNWYPNPHIADSSVPFGYPCNDSETGPCKTWKWGWWGMVEGYGCAIRDYAFAVRSGRRTGGLYSTYLSNCESGVTSWGDSVRSWSKDNNVYRTSFLGGSLGFGWQPHFYVSAYWAFDIAASDQIERETSSANHELNRNAIIENMNYEAGRNPNNVSFVTGLGWRRQRAVVSLYSLNDRRILPPSGLPIGNMAYQFDVPGDPNGYQLNTIYSPAIQLQSPFSSTSFALYDRWADAFNIITEPVIPWMGRSLAVASLIGAETSANRQQAWSSAQIAAAQGTIDYPNGNPALNTPKGARVSSPTVDLSNATIVWEAEGEIAEFKNYITVGRGTVGELWLEAEVTLPDGRRVFANTTTLVNDPINGGTEFPNSGAIALYHFNNNFNDSISGYNLTTHGNVTFSDNTAWMQSPSGKSVRFKKVGDYLDVSIPDSAILPSSGTTLQIEFQFYPRAYKVGDVGALLFALVQDDDAKWLVFDPPTWSAPYPKSEAHSITLLDSIGWNNHVTLNTWHSIRFTMGSDGITHFFVDGTERGSVSTLPNYGRTSGWTLSLGNFDGEIDELRIKH